VVRTLAQLREVIELNPLGPVASDGSKQFVAFLSAEHDPAEVERMTQAVAGTGDEVHAHGREIYLWCPNGIHKSPLAKTTMGKRTGTVATVRNWNTVTRLAAMIDEEFR